jgi:hypothetical protein
MASGGGFSGWYAFFIIGLMILGVIAGAFYFYRPSVQANPCGNPGPSQFSSEFTDSINGTSYEAILINFTDIRQNLVLTQVTFLTTSYSNPAQPHLVGSNCVTDATTPASISIQVTFANDHFQETLSIHYNGDLTTETHAYSSHVGPRAGVVWKPGHAYLELVVG